MNIAAAFVLSALVAYLFGSIPVGIFVVRLFKPGTDLREFGSGRTGGTNAGRAGGLPAGILTGLGDMGKGILAVLAGRLIASLLLQGLHQDWLPVLDAVCGVASVLGHNYSVFIGFKGGAGTAPNVGAATVMLWPWWYIAPLMIVLVPLVLFTTGYASVASTSAAVIVALIMFFRMQAGGTELPHFIFSLVTTILVAIALIPNYKRLIAGSERLVGPRAKRAREQENAADDASKM